MKAYRFKGFDVKPAEDYLESRVPVLTNKDCTISLAAPTSTMSTYFYKNAQNDEVVFVHEGSGTLKTQFGDLDFSGRRLSGHSLEGMIQQFQVHMTQRIGY